MKQRWFNRKSPKGLLNISIDDITSVFTDGVKRNILKACNECSCSGYVKDLEFASLLDVETGLPLEDCHLLEGTTDEVDISRWSDKLRNSKPLSLIIIHNHTIKAPFSFDDIKTFLTHTSIKLSILAVDTYAYCLEKSENSICDYDEFVNKLKDSFPGRSYFESNGIWDIKKLDSYLGDVFSKFGITYGRWS